MGEYQQSPRRSMFTTNQIILLVAGGLLVFGGTIGITVLVLSGGGDEDRGGTEGSSGTKEPQPAPPPQLAAPSQKTQPPDKARDPRPIEAPKEKPVAGTRPKPLETRPAGQVYKWSDGHLYNIPEPDWVKNCSPEGKRNIWKRFPENLIK